MKERIYETICYTTLIIGIIGMLIGLCSFPSFGYKTSLTVVLTFFVVTSIAAILMDIKTERDIREEKVFHYIEYLECKEKIS